MRAGSEPHQMDRPGAIGRAQAISGYPPLGGSAE